MDYEDTYENMLEASNDSTPPTKHTHSHITVDSESESVRLTLSRQSGRSVRSEQSEHSVHSDRSESGSDSESCDGEEDTMTVSASARDVSVEGRILRGPEDQTALVGGRVELVVKYEGVPEPEVKWVKAGRKIGNDSRTTIINRDGVSILTIEDITTDDSGKYIITVENNHGSDCHFASVSVEGPPDPPGLPLCTPSLSSILVTWASCPYDGGRMVQGYSLEMLSTSTRSPEDAKWKTVANECHSLSYTVHDLSHEEEYKFRVRAYNVHGKGEGRESAWVRLKKEEEAPNNTMTTQPSVDFLVNYSTLEELGKGRYGVVRKVLEVRTQQVWAAKFVKCRTSKDKDKVRDEIDIMNTLRHEKLLQLEAVFESSREMILVMEYISGGELFERVVADDFTLTERDCILFLRQICEGVSYMHRHKVVHLDLKPENIMCRTRTSHEVKIIDFGLAQKLQGEPVRVLFGTPEFIAPEVISYEPIGVESDMWSIGVICYVLLSGLSPFMGDTDAETFANITRADYDFEDEAFELVSEDARDFIKTLLIKRKENRLSADECLKHRWMTQHDKLTNVISTDKLKKFIIRRKWQKTGNAIRAVGRMANLSANRRNSSGSSTPVSTSPRPSVSGQNISRMSSLNEEDDDIHLSHNINVIENKNDNIDDILVKSYISDDVFTENNNNLTKIDDLDIITSKTEEIIDDIIHVSKANLTPITDLDDLSADENTTKTSTITNQTLEVTENENSSNTTEIITITYSKKVQSETSETNLKFTDKHNINEEHSSEVKLPRMRVCSERSDSGISDCSVQPTAQNSTSLINKQFCISEETDTFINKVETKNVCYTNKEIIENPKECSTRGTKTNECPPSKTDSLKFTLPKTDVVANTLKKFEALSTNPSKPAKEDLNRTYTPILIRKSRPSVQETKRTLSISPDRFLSRNTFVTSSVRYTKGSPKNISDIIKGFQNNTNTEKVNLKTNIIKAPRNVGRLEEKAELEYSKQVMIKTEHKSDNKVKENITEIDCTSDTVSNDNNEHIKTSKTLIRPKKTVIEKHLDTTSTFKKAAAFWNKS